MKSFEKVASLALLLAVITFKVWVGDCVSQESSNVSGASLQQLGSSASPIHSSSLTGPVGGSSQRIQVRDEFSAQVDQAWSLLPTTESLRSLSHEEAHDTPEVILQGGRAVGEIAERVAKDPLLKTRAAAFYQHCAEATAVAVPIRALCLSQLRELKTRYGMADSIETSHVSSEVIRLANLI